MSSFKAECRKFQPNIFNKNKCSNCFRQRDEHSAAALESNRVETFQSTKSGLKCRSNCDLMWSPNKKPTLTPFMSPFSTDDPASRKVSKCGYLFVAPDWDFSIPLNRTKRWQRRWFVLYDDGELTYSVDDLPATIPQGVIDMTRVLEVIEAEDVTGNQFALAITSPDRATFVKGTCKEESRWWLDVLSVFPKQHGRHKRNATFPGIKSSSVLQQTRSSLARTPSPSLAPSFDTSLQRTRFDSLTVARPSSAPTLGGRDDVFPSPTQAPMFHSTPARTIRDEHKENTPPYIQDYDDHPPTSESPPTQDKVLGHKSRMRRISKKGYPRSKSQVDITTNMHVPTNPSSTDSVAAILHVQRHQRTLNRYSDFPSVKKFVSLNLSSVDPLIISELQDSKREEKLKDIADSITRPRGSPAFLHKEIKPTRESEALYKSSDVIDSSIIENIRGDPDGCGLENEHHSFPPVSDVQRVDLPAEEVLYIKKGWLLKQSLTMEWSKHWFVLKGTALRFYRDPSAEDNGILDGFIDLGMVKNVQEREVGRNYGFIITTWENKKYTFSAVTLGIRSNWVQALRNAANLKDTDKIDKELFPKEPLDNSYRNSSLNRSFVSSDEDFKTASDASFFKDESEDLTNYECSSDKSSTSRSRSSPPSTRRGTRDDILKLSEKPEKDFNSGESMLVDLLETEVESLKAKLEQTQVNYVELHNENLELMDRLSSLSSQPSLADPNDFSQDPSLQLVSDKSTVENQRLTIGSLRADASNLKRRLAIYEADLDRSERETDRLRTDKRDLQDKNDLYRDHIGDMKQQLDSLHRTVDDQQSQIDDKNCLISKLEGLQKQFQLEKKQWEERLTAEKKRDSPNGDIVRRLSRSLQEAETKLSKQSNRSISDDNSEKMKQENKRLRSQVLGLTVEIGKLKENLKSEKSEVYKWKDLVKELRSLLDGRNAETELDALRGKLKATQMELDQTADRLYRGIEENESLCNRIREFERTEKVRRGSSSLSISSSKFSSRKSLPRLDSLSDLTNIDFNLDPDELDRDRLIEEFTDLRLRFEKAVSEIKALKREMKESQSNQDTLELLNQRLKDEIRIKEEETSSEINLMSTRNQDLTAKLSNSEKQLRIYKQKMCRAESRERRRTQSLKGKESFSLSKDMEVKLSQLESRVETLLHEGDSSLQELKETNKVKTAKRSKSFEESTKSSRFRRKSLDSQSDAMKAIVRINDIESKMAVLSGEDLRKAMETSSNNSSTSNITLSTPRSKSPPNCSPIRSPISPRKSLRSPRSDKAPKLYRSESEPKILREKLCALEKVLNLLQSRLNECTTLSGVMECTCLCSSSVLSRLQKNLSAASRLAQCRHVGQVALNRMEPLTSKLHQLLKDKISDLLDRRQSLRAKGLWTRDAQLKSFAERLAFETLLISQLSQMQQATHRPQAFESSVKLQELVEAHRKLSFLEKKLTNPQFDMEPSTPFDFYTSLLAEKLVVEGDVQNLLCPPQTKTIVSDTCKDLQNKVLERERTLSKLVSEYKREKLQELAVVMARETVAGTTISSEELPEELRLGQAWSMAQEMVGQELVNLEASQSLLRLTHVFGSQGGASLVSQLTAASLEKLHSGAEESLRQEMEESAFTLSSQYERVLTRYRSGDNTVLNSVSASINDVLKEFAQVVAQKALVDGQLALATCQDTSSSESLVEAPADVDPIDSATDVVASESHLLMFLGAGDPEMESKVSVAMDHAEFTFIYNQTSASCASQVENLVSNVIEAKGSDREIDLPKSTPSPKTRRRSETSRKSRRVSDITGMIEGCKQCDELRQELSRVKRSLEAKRLQRQEEECRKCADHIQMLKHFEEDHRTAMESLQRNHEAERLKDRVKYELPTRDSDDELTELKRRLCLLEEGYEAQISALKKQYEDSDEESVRQRYQQEIEHLRELCENGLNSMESSHRRLLQEMEEKHRREMTSLRAEKEEALAEETRATLAALDAMRKAHEAEVQKEVAKFKEDFLRRSQGGGSHLEEVREVRREILDLSEKYSGKCLEVAAKEQRMETLRKRLTETKQNVKDLEERNQQLKARLTSQASHLMNEEPKSAYQWKKIHETQLSLKNEEIARLNQLVEQSKSHDSKLSVLCGPLNHLMHSDRVIEETMHRKDEGRRSLRQGKSETDSTFLSSSTRREIFRSPSCPRLSSMLWRNDNSSPLYGMVALRKKVFEGQLTTKTEC